MESLIAVIFEQTNKVNTNMLQNTTS